MTLKRNKKTIIRVSILIAVLLLIVVLVAGCVQGMTPIGWAGVAINNGTAYTASKEGRLVAVTLSNSALQLADPLKAASTGGAGCGTSSGGGACGGAAPAIAIYGTPAIANNIPVGVDSQGNPVLGAVAIIAGYNGKVVAYQSNNLRNMVWEYPKGSSNLSPIVSAVTVSGTSVYFGCNDGNVYALDVVLGNPRWSAPFKTGGEVWATPIVDNNNTVYVGSFDKKIYAIDANTGAQKWAFDTGANNVAPTLVQDGIVYVGSLDRNMYALNAADGSLIWKFPANNWFWAPPVLANGVIYAPALDNFVYALDAKTGNKLAQYDAKGQIASWPVIAGNQVIVATKNKQLWGIDISNINSEPKLIATIVENVDSPLGADGDVVYINGPDNKLYGYNVVTLASLPVISLSSQ